MGDRFFIIKDGEAQVIAGDKEVNRLFKADFFGEQALLQDEPRCACARLRAGGGGGGLLRAAHAKLGKGGRGEHGRETGGSEPTEPTHMQAVHRCLAAPSASGPFPLEPARGHARVECLKLFCC